VTVALHGNLRDFGIGEVFQLIGQQRKTGVLEVRGEQGEVELRFDAGGVVAAAPAASRSDAALVEMIARCGLVPRDRLGEIERDAAPSEPLGPRVVAAGLLGADALREVEDLLTRETIFDLLRWEDGSFRFVAQPIAHERPADQLLGAEQVLMDGLRMVDEWRAFESEMPEEGVVFRRRGSLEEYRRSPAGRAAASPGETERVYMLVDGRSSVRRVIDLSQLGTFLAMRILVQLARAGWIEPVTTRRAATGHDGAPVAASEQRRRVATFAPLALLALLALLATWTRAPRPLEPDALPVAALAEARAQVETARWRALVLAHRLATGKWAADLDAVAQWAGEPPAELTRSERGAYYVGRRAEGPIVLAPEP
jgi:hypothetical protein